MVRTIFCNYLATPDFVNSIMPGLVTVGESNALQRDQQAQVVSLDFRSEGVELNGPLNTLGLMPVSFE